MTANMTHAANGNDGYGTVTAADTVRFERLLPGPIERVWSYITESDKRVKWLAAGPMELRAGGEMKLTFRNSELSPHGEPTPEEYKKYEGSGFSAKVIRCEPPRLLTHSWGGEPGQESEVTYELTPEGDKVRLVLTHRRLGNSAAMLSVSGGWHTHLDVLASILNDEVPQPFWAKIQRLNGEYRQRQGVE